ncbi:MAG: hypothetical protein ACXAC8_09530 [Candidatus Hodarchaeales archaeon]|jgi:hypothetical protein
MESENNQEAWNRFFGGSYSPIPFNQTPEYNLWKIALARNAIQTTSFLFAIFLPWYHLYRPPTSYREAFIIEVGAHQLGGQMLGILMFTVLVSLSATIWLIVRRNRRITSTLPFDLLNFTLSLIILGFLGDPVFLPGLGGLYSDYISLFVLNWAGFQILPLIGYFMVLISISSVVIGLIIYLIFL